SALPLHDALPIYCLWWCHAYVWHRRGFRPACALRSPRGRTSHKGAEVALCFRGRAAPGAKLSELAVTDNTRPSITPPVGTTPQTHPASAVLKADRADDWLADDRQPDRRIRGLVLWIRVHRRRTPVKSTRRA